ncbi:MAG TPA: DUF1684 domain-containing protein [Candidatus Limnocylindria bacterium]|nr:DUF1684 domain-containing protein [Candidatus Limnocylindria bacterium]
MTLDHDHDTHAGHDHDDHAGHAEHDHDDHAGHDHAGHEHVDYPTAVANFRAEKDDFFRDAHDSPIPEAERDGFIGLPYFPVDEDLRFEGLSLEPYTGSEPVGFQIPTSDGQLRAAERAGTFTFEVGGTPQRLTGYRFADGDAESVFVPFLDTTSGTETYGAGRYLDLYPEEDGTFSLDFNLAYHPSCVYDPKFSCPLTPAENRLPLRIAAGERLPGDHA